MNARPWPRIDPSRAVLIAREDISIPATPSIAQQLRSIAERHPCRDDAARLRMLARCLEVRGNG